MTPNRRLLKLLALIELGLAILFAAACLYVYLVQPDSLQLQFMLVIIGLAGIVNGLILFRKVKQSRKPTRRSPQRGTAGKPKKR